MKKKSALIKSKPNQLLECRVNVDKLTLRWKSDVNKFHSIVVTLEELVYTGPSLADVRLLNPHEVNPYKFDKIRFSNFQQIFNRERESSKYWHFQTPLDHDQ